MHLSMAPYCCQSGGTREPGSISPVRSSTTGYAVEDHRVKFDFGDPDDQAELYTDFDALILPQRYGGLCLPMNEALLSGLLAQQRRAADALADTGD
jgi:hypothetical protein